jgi:hypothetical protein
LTATVWFIFSPRRDLSSAVDSGTRQTQHNTLVRRASGYTAGTAIDPPIVHLRIFFFQKYIQHEGILVPSASSCIRARTLQRSIKNLLQQLIQVSHCSRDPVCARESGRKQDASYPRTVRSKALGDRAPVMSNLRKAIGISGVRTRHNN